MVRKKASGSKRESGGRSPRASEIVQQPVAQVDDAPAGYGVLLADLKERIRTAQVKAHLAVNRELLELYWYVGWRIVERQTTERWGRKVIERLAGDLQREFPGISGFSARNLWRMRAFFLAYSGAESILPQPAAELSLTGGGTSRQARRDGLVSVERSASAPILPQPAAGIPWFHNVILIEKVKGSEERLWYARQTVEHGWSRPVLEYHNNCRRNFSGPPRQSPPEENEAPHHEASERRDAKTHEYE